MSPAAAERDRSRAPSRESSHVGPAAAAAIAGVAATGEADPRLARYVAELRTRLRPICADWDEAAFEALVLCMAQTKVRWADVESGRA